MTDHETDEASIKVHMGSYLMGLRDGAADPGKARRSLEANGPLMDEPGFAEASAEAKQKLDAAHVAIQVCEKYMDAAEGGEFWIVNRIIDDLHALTRLAVPHPIMSPDDVVLEAMRVFAREVGAAAPEEVPSRVRERWERGMRAVIAFLSPLGTSALARLAVTQPAAAPDAGGWLPIESAPKDGTEVDLWHTSGWRLLNCYWVNSEDGEWRESGWTANGGFFWPNEDITHWRPLPPPPGASAHPVAPAPGAGDAAIRDVLAERRRQVVDEANLKWKRSWQGWDSQP